MRLGGEAENSNNKMSGVSPTMWGRGLVGPGKGYGADRYTGLSRSAVEIVVGWKQMEMHEERRNNGFGGSFANGKLLWAVECQSGAAEPLSLAKGITAAAT